MMTREFTDYEEELEDDVLPGRRRQSGVRVKLRGGLPRSRGGKIAVVIGALVFVGLCGAVAMIARSAILHDERFMIPSATAIETLGNTHVTRSQLVGLFGEDIERNIFRVPLEERRAQLEELPWVQHATVMRLLPNHLRVSVVERTPVAFVRQGNRIGLVDANGILLDMPAGTQGNTHYSFPVVTGLAESDPLSLRAARMKVYARFTSELDGGGEKISERLSEVDLSNPEDVRAAVQDKGGEVMVHFGEDNFLDRYKKFEEHLPEWRQQYPHLASVDMRYERQVVLEMQPGTTAPVVGEQIVPAAGNGGSEKPVVTPAPAPANKVESPSTPHSAVSSNHAAAVTKKKVVVKTASKARKPPTKKSTPPKTGPAKGGTAEQKTSAAPASAVRVSGESFWVHPKRVVAGEVQGSSTHSPQVVHP